MKRRLIAALLCFAMVLTLLPILPTYAFGDENFAVTKDGAVVSSVTLPENEKVTLSADGVDGASYQWQIHVSSDLWVNISGANSKTVELSYAMVASLLNGGEASVRCSAVVDGETVFSDAVAVKVQYVDLSTDGPTIGAVVSQAKELERQVTPPDNQNSPDDGGVSIASFSARTMLLDDDDENSDESSDPTVESSAPDDNTEDPVYQTVNIVIQYVFAKDGQPAADPYTAEVAVGSDFYAIVQNPSIVGYLPYEGESDTTSDQVILNFTDIQANQTITVYYKSTLVNYTVKYMLQNVNGEGYYLDSSETKQGLTDATVSLDETELANKYPGFSMLWFDSTTIAADGSTVVEVYYERNFYLMLFDLDGGYGVEPIYARYGSSIPDVGVPTLAGYSFEGWSLDGANIVKLPATMPSSNTTYIAIWTVDDYAKVTVVIWGENADDENYSYIKSIEGNVKPGTQFTYSESSSLGSSGMDASLWTFVKSDTVTVAADGSSVVNAYYDRKTFTLTFNANNKTVATITAKWGAEISGEFNKAPFNTTYNGRAWECTDTRKYGYALQTLDRMPQFNATFNLYNQSSNTLKTIYYYVENVGANVSETQWPNSATNFTLLKTVTTYFNYATYEEEYHEIEGFTRYSARVAGFSSSRKDFSNNTLYLYYLRNDYDLVFNDGYEEVKRETVQYEAPLSTYSTYVPSAPDAYEPGSVEFAGWYLNPQCTGDEYVLREHTMPLGNLILYAKWVPVTHKVEFYLDDAALEKGEKLSTHPDVTVTHGSKVTPAPTDPTNGNMNFIGWFYMDGDVEKAFDFNNMPVTKDLKVYGKWSDQSIVPFYVYYKVKNEDGTETEIADPTTGSALANISRTFEALGGTDLYAAYQEGFFPVVKSHTLTLSATDSTQNTFTFYYEARDAVPYTVKYLEEGTGNVLATEKVVSDNRKAVVTETFKVIPGYMPDAYQKRLVVSAEENAENVIIFYYHEDSDHAYYAMSHYLQNLDGTSYTQLGETSQQIGDVGTTYYADPYDDIPGFTYVESKTEIVVNGETKTGTSDELTIYGLEIKHYYDRNTYPYVVRYLEKGTDKVLAPEKSGTGVTGLYGQVISENMKTIPGYECISPATQTVTIRVDEYPNSDGTQPKNLIVFYYQETSVTINYVVDGPIGCGTVVLNQVGTTPAASASETVKAATETAVGATAEPANNTYRFDGWYDAAGNLVSSDAKYVPEKVNGVNVEATYYARFAYNLTDLTITKELSATSSKDESFILNVTIDNQQNMTLVVKVPAGKSSASVKISGLTVGQTVTVTEDSSYNRDYAATKGSDTVTLQADQKNELTINNGPSGKGWLSESAHIANWFKN